MGHSRIVARNVLWNWAGTAIALAAAFGMAPFLVRRLGESTYGLWILISSAMGYFALLDLGLRGSVGRHVAFCRATRDQRGINAILRTAQVFLGGMALVTLVGTFALTAWAPRLFHVSADRVWAVRATLFVSGLNVAVTLALSVFDATLWAFERFDLINAIEIPVALMQTALTFVLIGRGFTLVALASLVLLSTVCRDVAKMLVCFRVVPGLAVTAQSENDRTLGTLFAYGLWNFLWTMGSRGTAQIGPLLIGGLLNISLVTPYSVASRLIGYANVIVSNGTNVLTPLATSLHARERHQSQRQLLVEGGKICWSLSILFTAGMVLLGKAFIALWMGGKLATAWKLLTLLTLGEALPMSQGITCGILQGMNRNRLMACASVVELLLVVLLGAALAKPLGLAGVCIAVAVSGTLIRGMLPIAYACRSLGMPVARYVGTALVLPLIAAAAPVVGLAAMIHRQPPVTWPLLIAYGGAYGMCALISFAILIGRKQFSALASPTSMSVAELA